MSEKDPTDSESNNYSLTRNSIFQQPKGQVASTKYLHRKPTLKIKPSPGVLKQINSARKFNFGQTATQLQAGIDASRTVSRGLGAAGFNLQSKERLSFDMNTPSVFYKPRDSVHDSSSPYLPQPSSQG